MREISKVLSVPVDGKSMDFRLTKPDAFSGVSLLRMLEQCMGVIPSEVEGSLPPVPARDSGFMTAECPKMAKFLFLPVNTGMWQQHELWDGTYNSG